MLDSIIGAETAQERTEPIPAGEPSQARVSGTKPNRRHGKTVIASPVIVVLLIVAAWYMASHNYERTNINPGVIELANQVYVLVKSVTTDTALLAAVQVFSYAFQELQVAGVKLFESYTLGNLVWVAMLGMIGVVMFDIGDRVSPLLASLVKRGTRERESLNGMYLREESRGLIP